MLSNRFQLSIIAAVFFALGIGILLGGTLGGQWLNNRQQVLVNRLEKRFSQEHQYRRDLEKKVAQLRSAMDERKKQNQLLTQQLIKNQLNDRYILLVGGDDNLQRIVEQRISWAGGKAVRASFSKGIPEAYDAVIFLSDSVRDRNQKKDVLNDLRLAYQAPVIVHMTAQEILWQRDWDAGTHSFVGQISEPLQSIQFIQTVQEAITKEKEPDYAFIHYCHYSGT